ncbi:hypothetical protein GQ44DRAFT_713813 [Phaeosphaeriaceae sp. PMI808]|nr:hypothetical protein GQ44DRAFT_713813 [Phaeosphaeriaceae sp. PMI808]
MAFAAVFAAAFVSFLVVGLLCLLEDDCIFLVYLNSIACFSYLILNFLLPNPLSNYCWSLAAYYRTLAA